MRSLDLVRNLARDLVSDCARCAAVCCVATSFDASEDFALAKPAGAACDYLRPDCRCGIHDQLVERGFRGCAIYDCFGAGPRVTRAFAGRADCDRERNEAFLVLRVVHELLWLLTQAAGLCSRVRSTRTVGAQRGDIDRDMDRSVDREIDDEIERNIDREIVRNIDREIERNIDREIVRNIDREIDALAALAALPPTELLALDLRPHIGAARAALQRVGDAIGGRECAPRMLAVLPRRLRRAG